MMDVKHISHVGHEHPLALLIQDESSPASASTAKEGSRCSACEGGVDHRATPTYGCASGCKFYLHKACAQLELSPELVSHPLHPLHPLILLPKPSYESGRFLCNFCRGSFSGLVYHCDLCKFDLDVHCALLQSFDNKLQHPAHDHALFFVSETYNKQPRVEILRSCSACGLQFPAGGCSVYRCMDCYWFHLHKECAELPLPLEIMLPLIHPPHPLSFEPKIYSYSCEFCGGDCNHFGYYCQLCMFPLHFDCALLLFQSSKFPIILERSPHQHPLIFIEKLNRTIEGHHCIGCCKEYLSEGQSIYRCFDCDDELVFLHKKCAELALEINHPLDRKHPLTLLQTPPLHPKSCSCYICRLKWKGFVYYCQYGCELGIIPEDAESPAVITAPNHEHPWSLLSRPISFVCDFCGTDGDRTPYLCTTCNLIVHRDCISLPHGIRIIRHPHSIFHSYFIPAANQNQLEMNSECRICHKEVKTGFGSYHCYATNCNYIVHVKCATDENVWDGTIVEAGNYEGDEGESGNLITDVIRTMCVKGEDMAIEIKHAYHSHNLLLHNFNGVDIDDNAYEDEDDRNCDGCMRPISNTTLSMVVISKVAGFVSIKLVLSCL